MQHFSCSDHVSGSFYMVLVDKKCFASLLRNHICILFFLLLKIYFFIKALLKRGNQSLKHKSENESESREKYAMPSWEMVKPFIAKKKDKPIFMFHFCKNKNKKMLKMFGKKWSIIFLWRQACSCLIVGNWLNFLRRRCCAEDAADKFFLVSYHITVQKKISAAEGRKSGAI